MRRIFGPHLGFAIIPYASKKGPNHLEKIPCPSGGALKRNVRSMSEGAANIGKKICATCGREISWRKKWEKNWDSIIYCSASCRGNKVKVGSLDEGFESKILGMLRELQSLEMSGSTSRKFITCEDAEEATLSELGSQSINDEIPGDQVFAKQSSTVEKKIPVRTRERCRQAARRLAARGDIIITQSGKTIDPSFAKGVMELRLAI